MRTEYKKHHVLLVVPAEVGYQFDDNGPGGPHYMEWRGYVAGGATKAEAKSNLGYMIGGGIIGESPDPDRLKENDDA